LAMAFSNDLACKLGASMNAGQCRSQISPNSLVDLRRAVDPPRTPDYSRPQKPEPLPPQRRQGLMPTSNPAALPTSCHVSSRNPPPAPPPGVAQHRRKGTNAFLEAVQIVASTVSGPCAGGHRRSERRRSERSSLESQPPQLRWYHVHPVGDAMKCIVRPDAGRRGRSPGLKCDDEWHDSVSRPHEASAEGDLHIIQTRSKGAAATARRRYKSLPREIERRISVPEPQGFEVDAFHNTCRICFERPCQVVTLPCRHFFMCKDCLRRHNFSRPMHRGGRDCPLCRRFIREVVYLYGDAAIPQYGFAIRT